jgi:hypothetical protein
MAAIFHYAIRINILHSASPLNPRIQVEGTLTQPEPGLPPQKLRSGMNKAG